MSAPKKSQPEKGNSGGNEKPNATTKGAGGPANANAKGRPERGSPKPANNNNNDRERQSGNSRPRREEGGEQRPPRRDNDGNGGSRKERPQNPRNNANNNGSSAPRDKREDGAKASAGAASASGAVIQCKKDITAAPTWNKGGKGPSFADMVRQKANGAASAPAAQAAKQPAPAQAEETAAKKSPASTPAPAEPTAEKESKPLAVQPPQVDPAMQEPSQAAAAAAVAIVEDEDDEEVVFNTPSAMVSAAAPLPEQQKPAPTAEPEAPAAAPAAVSYYVLEFDRVERVKLPENVIRGAREFAGTYTFSAQPGKAPTPVVQAPPVMSPQPTIYRSDVANLHPRTAVTQASWGISDARMPAQQQLWHPTTGLDWGDRSGVPANLLPQQQQQQRYPQHQGATAVQYQQHQVQQQQQMRTGQNFFPSRLRQEPLSQQQQQQDLVQPSAAGFRGQAIQQPQFSRATTNGGGFW